MRSGRAALSAAFAVIALSAACGQRPGIHARAAQTEEISLVAKHSPTPERTLAPPAGYRPSGELGAAPVAGSQIVKPGTGSSPRPATMPLYLSYVVTTVKHSAQPPSMGSDPFAVCPVAGAVHGYDGFGAPRFAGGYHPHAGIDMMADSGVPIVAPFPGTAVASPNGLGGNAVKVFGARGWVYNAHLSRYGRLGPVRTGDVIGYVGNTGDAMGGPPHDHFEWHPFAISANPWISPYGYSEIGGAVDPFSYLVEVCR